MAVQLSTQISELDRLLGINRKEYAAAVAKGKMRQAVSDLLLERQEAAWMTLMWVQKHEAVIRAAVEAAKVVTP